MDFISSAFAQVPGSTGSSSDVLLQLAPFAVILVIMYFLILRPQQRRAKQHQDLVKAVRRGDTLVTNAGLIGKVTKVIDDNEVEIEIAPNVRVRQLRQMISEVRSRGEPVKE
ncbi:MAG TPA: preprotein translocase subunit YajC [Beijerinckiaceae bacterium]|jgi:preprotein translocase subunit YajC|nr:preprotein translocase subunit YajC [Beijerinckiaceae bacterium]